MKQLKNCPFCGSEYVEISGFLVPFVHCSECGAIVSFYDKDNNEKLIQAWNKRNDTEK